MRHDSTARETQGPMSVMTRRQAAYLNIAVTVLTGVLAFNTLGNRGPSEALAQAYAAAPDGGGDETVSGRISAAEQRKQIIAELKAIQSKMEHMDGLLKGGITVKMADMPKQSSKDGPSGRERPEGKPEPRIEIRQAGGEK